MDYIEREYAEWALYDSITQSYRSNMLATQAILMAVTAIFYEKSCLLVVMICCFGLFNQWFIWYPVIRARVLISDYHKFNAKFNFSKNVDIKGNERKSPNQEELTEQEYVSKRNVRRNANAVIVKRTGNKKFKTNWRPTRRKLDILLPLSFSIIWVVILILSAVSFMYESKIITAPFPNQWIWQFL